MRTEPTTKAPATALNADFKEVPVVFECVTGSERRPRPTPHGGRHLDGCRMNFACGCVKRYYSSFYYKHGGRFAYYNPDKTFLQSHSDGLCVKHHAKKRWTAFSKGVGPMNPTRTEPTTKAPSDAQEALRAYVNGGVQPDDVPDDLSYRAACDAYDKAVKLGRPDIEVREAFLEDEALKAGKSAQEANDLRDSYTQTSEYGHLLELWNDGWGIAKRNRFYLGTE